MVNAKAQKLWDELCDVPVNDDEEIDIDWNGFDKGSHLYDIWHWFEEEFDLCVAEDLMGLKKK